MYSHGKIWYYLAIYTLTVQDLKILDHSTLFLLYTNYNCRLQNMTLQPQTDIPIEMILYIPGLDLPVTVPVKQQLHQI